MIALLVALGTASAGDGALSDGAYRFCHEPGFDASEAKEWCELLGDLPEDRCPGLRATCAGAEDPGRGCDAWTSPGRASSGLGGQAKPPPPPTGCDPGFDLSLDGLQAILRWVLALAVALLVLLLARLLIASFGRRREPPPAPTEPARATQAEAPADVPVAPSGDQLDQARAALRSGRFGDAVVLARGAALRALGERGRLELHRARTDREYARALRGDPAGEDLGEVVRAHERVRFGGVPADRALAERAMAAAARILGVAVAVLLVPLAARAQTRYDANGDAALLQVLTEHGCDAGYRLRSLSDLDDGTDALFLDLTAVAPTDDQWAHVRDWVGEGAVLVVAGDASSGLPELGTFETGPTAGLAPSLDPAFGRELPTPRWPDGPSAWWSEGSGRVLLPGGEEGQAVVELLDLGPGVVVAIADPRLLWNAAFVDPRNEAFVGDLLYAGQQLEGWPVATPARVQLATVAAAASSSSPDPLASVAHARLLLFVLQLLLAWTVLSLWRGWPFAPLRDPPEEGRQRFVDHVRALADHWAGSRSSGWAARAWAGLWLLRLGPAGLQSAAVRSGRTREEAAAFAAEVERRAGGDGSRNEPGDLAFMEELWRVTRSVA